MKRLIVILTVVFFGAFYLSLAVSADDLGKKFLKNAIQGAATGAAASAGSGGKAGTGRYL
jgi:hypothetical protein